MGKVEDRQALYPNLRRGAAPRGAPEKQSTEKPKGRNTRGLKRGGSPGRKPGVPNKVTREVKELAQRILENAKGQAKLIEQYERGRLPPPVLCMLFHYAYGKPKERVEVNGQIDVLRFVITDQIEAPMTSGTDITVGP